MITDLGDPGSRASPDRANMAQDAVDPDLDTFPHPNLRAVQDHQTGPDLGPRVQIEAGDDLEQFAHDREQHARWSPKPRRPRLSQSPLHAVDRNGPESL